MVAPSSLEVTDAESAAVAKAPRVSLDDIDENIVGIHYITGEQAARAVGDDPAHTSLSVFTMCLVVLQNGYVVVGHAAPAVEANFNPALGRKFAYEDAIRKIWPLMGYELRQRQFNLAKATDLPEEK